MRLRLSKELLVLSALLFCSPVFAEGEGDWLYVQPLQLPSKDAKIVKGPAVAKLDDGTVAISFEIDKPTDVAVRVVDADGKTVRHLASGVLGKNAPPPFQPDALAQTVKWDGLDDSGRPVDAKGLQVRVDVGMKAELERSIGSKPGLPKYFIYGLDVDPQGNVYVMNTGAHMSHPMFYIHAFDRDGKHARTVMPYNPNVPFERLRDSIRQLVAYELKPFVKLPTGDTVPVACGAFSLNEKWPGLLGQVLDIPGGHKDASPFVRLSDGRFLIKPFIVGVGGFKTLDPDGLYSVPLSALKLPGKLAWDGWHRLKLLADAADGLYLFSTSRTLKEMCHAVYRYDGRTLAPADAFVFSGKDGLDAPVSHLGEPGVPGEDEKHLTDPVDVAVDRAKNILVAEKDGRLKRYRKDGLFLGAIKLPFGETRGISCGKYPAAEDTVYVLGADATGGRKWKIGAAKVRPATGEVVWRIDLSEATYDSVRGAIAVDASKDPVVVWIGGGAGHGTFTRIEDLGDRANEPRHLPEGRDTHVLQPYRLCVDLDEDALFMADVNRPTIMRMRASDGGGLTPLKDTVISLWSTTAAIAMDRARDRLYVMDGTASIKCMDYEGGTLPFPELRRGSPVVDREGSLYVSRVMVTGKWFKETERAQAVKGKNEYRDPKGAFMQMTERLLKEDEWQGPLDLVWVRSGGTKDDQVKLNFMWCRVTKYDADGKLLVDKYAVPNSARGSVAVDSRGFVYAMDTINRNTHCYSWGPERRYPYEAHHLIKYAPEGVHDGEGELWRRPGISPVLGNECGCGPQGQANVDEFDRVFVTDGTCHNVKAFDTAGNLIACIGSYGNEDCSGPGSANPKPVIALNRPAGVDVQRDTLFIADTNNGRVLRCRLVYGDSRIQKIE